MHLKELFFLLELILEGKLQNIVSENQQTQKEKLAAHLGTVPELSEVKQEDFSGFHCILDQGSQLIPLTSAISPFLVIILLSTLHALLLST